MLHRQADSPIRGRMAADLAAGGSQAAEGTDLYHIKGDADGDNS